MSWFKRTPQDWELIDKTVLPSAYQQVKERGDSLKNAPWVAFEQTVIFTFKDKISGAIKQEKHTS